MTREPICRKPGAGRRIGIVGDIYRFLATAEETDGKYTTFEALVPPGGGPPPHVHTREEESFLVLEGEMTFQLEHDRMTVGEGTFLNIPIGTLHSFRNEGSQPARMLITLAPAGLEGMFFEVGQPLADDEDTASPPNPGEIEKLLQVAPDYGVEIHAGPH